MLFYARLAALLLVSLFIVAILVSVMPVLFFYRRKWRLLIDNFQALWVNSLLWLLPKQYLELYGDLPDASLRPKIIIANHQCDVDWVFLWMLARMTNRGQCDRSGSVKIMLKKEVQYIPVCGWGCYLFDFIFLRRKWEADKHIIEDKLIQFCQDEQPLWIFLFPEGTTINQRSLTKSRSFALETNRPLLDNLLLPRVRGLQHVLAVLNEHSPHAPEIFDLTMSFESYSGEIPTWEAAYSRNVDVLVPNFTKLIMGTSSQRVAIDSQRFCYREMLSSGVDLQQWLDDRWLRKERLMKNFAEHEHFPTGECGMPVTVPIFGSIWRSLAAVCFYLALWAGMVFTYVKYMQDGDGFF